MKQSSKGVLIKRYFENMQQMYNKTRRSVIINFLHIFRKSEVLPWAIESLHWCNI